MIRTKRVYDPPSPTDGRRILVDRLWPRGLRKDQAHVDLWLRDVAPSSELRKWFGHDPARWDQFRRRFYSELKDNPALDELRRQTKGNVTLLFGAKEPRYNNAEALREYLQSHGRRKP